MTDLFDTNENIFELLKNIKERSGHEKLDGLVNKMNAVLLGAIIDHGDEVNAVKIGASVRINCREERFLETYSKFSGRYMLIEYLKIICPEHKTNDYPGLVFVKHLPYGSDKIEHFCSVRPTIFAERNLVKAHAPKRNNEPAYLEIALSEGRFDNDEKAHLFFDEINFIQLSHVEDNQYSKLMHRRPDGFVIDEPAGSLMHYLDFRLFRAAGFADRDMHQFLGEQLKVSSRDLMMPDMWSCLYPIDSGADVLNGFAVHFTPQGAVLYKFSDFQIPAELVALDCIGKHSARVAFAIDSHLKCQRPEVTTYLHDEIILKLHQEKPTS